MNEFLKSVVSENQAQVLVYLVLANLVLGTVAALKSGNFEFARFKDFGKRVLVVFGTYLGVSIASLAIADYSALREICWIALIAYMGTQIISNIQDLGMPIPGRVSKWLER